MIILIVMAIMLAIYFFVFPLVLVSVVVTTFAILAAVAIISEMRHTDDNY